LLPPLHFIFHVNPAYTYIQKVYVSTYKLREVLVSNFLRGKVGEVLVPNFLRGKVGEVLVPNFLRGKVGEVLVPIFLRRKVGEVLVPIFLRGRILHSTPQRGPMWTLEVGPSNLFFSNF
jgi:hypothetical protein